MKRIFVAATQQNDGKTTVSLGLIAALRSHGLDVGFIKPVGQRYTEIDGQKIDEDAVLIADVMGRQSEMAAMSPIAVEPKFTREYIDRPHTFDLLERITAAFNQVSAGKDFALIEGTGHAGVGSVFDLSNARVARHLESGVILVTGGGIGRPIDEIMLNRSLFLAHGVPVLGAVLNRALPEKLEMIRDYAGRGLARLGVDLLGVLPLRPRLASPTVRQVVQGLKGKLLNRGESLDEKVEHCVIDTMSPNTSFDHFAPGVLAIVPGDCEDLILAALGSCVLGKGTGPCVSGIVLTRGIEPPASIMRLVKRTRIPVALVDEDGYAVISRVNAMTVKILPGDAEKIRIAQDLVEEHVDIDRVLDASTW